MLIINADNAGLLSIVVGFIVGTALALLLGLVIGVRITPRLLERHRQETEQRDGLTVAQMLHHIVGHIPLGIAVVDQYRDVVFYNTSASTLHLVHDRLIDDAAWDAALCALTEKTEVQFDLSPESSHNELQVSVRGYARVLTEQDPRFAVVIVDDQSQQDRIEATRRDFVANVSHELKTPVGAMSLLAEALLESADEPVMVRRFAQKVLDESRRLALMMSELIELSRLQGGEPLPQLGAVDVDTIVANTIARHKIAADNANIVITADEPTGYRVLGDQTLLTTALANLVSNAINYSPHGSSVSISRRRNEQFIEIAVTDRGIGIAQADQERVFERFFRSDKARSRATGGTGLGLAIVKHIAANHNGAITLWSQLGTGSTFTLAIPIYHDDNSVLKD